MKNIQELFKRAGSIQQLAADLKRHQYSIQRWGENGIPRIHFDFLCKKYRISREELLKLDESIRYGA